MAKRLCVRAERVIAKMMATSSFLLLFACSGTINYHKTILIMPSKKIRKVFPHTITPSKGVVKDSTSRTIQSQAMSIKDMIQNHVQGTLDPTEYKEGQYDPEGIDHETDVSERSQATLLDALDYANENAMSKDQIQEFVDTFGTPPNVEVEKDKQELTEPLNEVKQNASEDSE